MIDRGTVVREKRYVPFKENTKSTRTHEKSIFLHIEFSCYLVTRYRTGTFVSLIKQDIDDNHHADEDRPGYFHRSIHFHGFITDDLREHPLFLIQQGEEYQEECQHEKYHDRDGKIMNAGEYQITIIEQPDPEAEHGSCREYPVHCGTRRFFPKHRE